MFGDRPISLIQDDADHQPMLIVRAMVEFVIEDVFEEGNSVLPGILVGAPRQLSTNAFGAEIVK